MLSGLRNNPLTKRLGLSSLSAAVQALINGALQRSGGTMTGALALAGNAANPLEAVPKQQMDAAIGTRAATAGSASQAFAVAAASDATHAVRLGQFGASFSASGYQRLPSGLIVQWGAQAGTGADVSVSFPLAFPTATLAVSATMLGNTPGNVSLACTVDQISTAAFTARPRFAAGGSAGIAAQGFNWIAIGY